jgi:hypothetical protein
MSQAILDLCRVEPSEQLQLTDRQAIIQVIATDWGSAIQ